jgi:hypothetical protein
MRGKRSYRLKDEGWKIDRRQMYKCTKTTIESVSLVSPSNY